MMAALELVPPSDKLLAALPDRWLDGYFLPSNEVPRRLKGFQRGPIGKSRFFHLANHAWLSHVPYAAPVVRIVSRFCR